MMTLGNVPALVIWGSLAAIAVIFLGWTTREVYTGVRYGAGRLTRTNYIVRGVLFVVAMSMLILTGFMTCRSYGRVMAAADTQIDDGYQAPSGGTVAAASNDGRYAIDPTGAQAWREKTFGDQLDDLRETVSKNMWPENAAYRNDAVAEFRDRNGRQPKFTDPANLPLGPTDTWLTRDLRDFYKLSKEDQADAIGEMILKVQIRLQTDPLYMLEFASMYRAMNDQILGDNPWIQEFIDAYTQSVKDEKGVTAFTEVSAKGDLRLNDETWNLGSYFGMLLDKFRDEGIQTLKAEESWTVNKATILYQVNIVVRSAGKDSWPALVFIDRVKDGTDGKDVLIGKFGVNVIDGSTELFPTVETTPTTPKGNRNPGGKTPPKENEIPENNDPVIPPSGGSDIIVVASAPLTIDYVCEGSIFHTYSVNLEVGAAYDVSTEREAGSKTGYTADKAFVSGTMTAAGVHEMVTFRPNTYHITVEHWDVSRGRAFAATETIDVPYNQDYTVEPVAHRGYTVSPRNFTGKMPARDFTVTFEYEVAEEETGRLRISYVYEDGSKASEPYDKNVTVGKPYRVVSPTIEGYIPEPAIVEGDMPSTRGVNVTVTYKRSPLYDLWIYYRKDNQQGAEAATPYHAQLRAGEEFDVPSPRVPGYTPDKPRVSGSKTSEYEVWTVVYRPDSADVTVTVHYRYADGGGVAHADKTWTGKTGDRYDITSPRINGYKASDEAISGRATQGDEIFTVFYYKDGEIPDGGGGKVETVRPDKVSDGKGGTNADKIGGNNDTRGDGEAQTTDPGQTNYVDPNGKTNGNGNGSTASNTEGSSTSSSTTTNPPVTSGGSDGKTSGSTGDKSKVDPTAIDSNTGKVAEGGTAPSTEKEEKPITTDKVTGTEIATGGSTSGSGNNASQGNGNSGNSGAGATTGGQHVNTADDGTNRVHITAPPVDD